MKPLPLIGGCLFIDNSSLERMVCPREGQYSFIERRITADDKPALNFGGANHLAWSHRYKRCGNKAVTPEVAAEINDILSNHFFTTPNPVEDFRTLSLAQAFQKKYNEVYRDEPFTVMKNTKGELAVEQSFALLLGAWSPFSVMIITEHEYKIGQPDRPWTIEALLSHGWIPIIYMGRIDLLLSDNEGEWILDHKTAFMFGQGFADEMAMTAQMPGYCWAFGETFGRLPRGYKVNAVRVRRPTKQEYIIDELVRKDDFDRLSYYITQDNIDEWKENTLANIGELFVRHAKGNFPMQRKQCRNKYGQCQFFNVCSLPRNSREMMLQSPNYTDNVWSPLNKPVEQVTHGINSEKPMLPEAVV